MKVHVEITAEDIENGARCDESRCPGALALRRALKESGVDILYVSVMPISGVTFKPRSGDRLRAETPDILKGFITKFDGPLGGEPQPVEPIAFDLEFFGKEEGHSELGGEG